MVFCLLHPLSGCSPGPKLGQISGFRRAEHARPVHLLADSGCGRYDAALLGTATIFTNLVALTGTAGVGLGVDWWWFLADADQADDWTLAIARLIERIRLADRRMATPPGIGLDLLVWG
jgi:hypothetical protein